MDYKQLRELADEIWSCIYDLLPFIENIDSEQVGEIESKLDEMEFRYRPLIFTEYYIENKERCDKVAETFWDSIKRVIDICSGKLSEREDGAVEHELSFLDYFCEKNGINLKYDRSEIDMEKWQILNIINGLFEVLCEMEKIVRFNKPENLEKMKAKLYKVEATYRCAQPVCPCEDEDLPYDVPF